MKISPYIVAIVTSSLMLALVSSGASAAAPRDLQNKVILANPEKHLVGLRLAGQQRQVQPGKASVLSPKQYPITIEYWSGNSSVGWSKMKIDTPGIYQFHWQGKTWSLAKRPSRSSTSTARATRGTSSTRSTSASSRASYQRSTGSYQRTLRGPTTVSRSTRYIRPPRFIRPPRYVIGWRGARWPYWVRGISGLAYLYQFIRDEDDRDVIRDIIMGGEIDDEIRREIEDAIRDDLVAVPYSERRHLEQAIDDISNLNPDDWKEITTLPANELDQIREDIGEGITDQDWEGLGGWVDTMDEPVDDINLDDIGVDSIDENIDLNDLDDAGDTLDLDQGLDVQDIDLDDVVGDAESMDLSDFGDSGYQGDVDLSDIGAGDVGLSDIGASDVGASDVGAGDFGGSPGFDAGGGGYGFDPGGYDAGGFDDWGGGYEGGGFDGGDFDGGGFDGGGFDDFGGGFDGGGFDDFGGGDDFF